MGLHVFEPEADNSSCGMRCQVSQLHVLVRNRGRKMNTELVKVRKLLTACQRLL